MALRLLPHRIAPRDPGGGEFGFRRGGGARQSLWRARLARDHSARHARWAWRFASAMPATPPSLQAWTEPALASHNRQLAVFITAVGALIAAAASDHRRAGDFDRPYRAALGGDHALHAVVELAGRHRHVRCQPGHPYWRALRADRVADRAGAWRRAPGWPMPSFLCAKSCRASGGMFRNALYVLCGLGCCAYLGVPGATLLTDTLIVPGSAAVAAYLIHLRPARHARGASDRAQRRRLCAGGAGGGRHQPGRPGRNLDRARHHRRLCRGRARCFWRWR